MQERLSERAQKVMAYANLEANRMGNNQIGTEHLLLGLLREGKGTAAGILKGLQVDLVEVGNEIERLTPTYAAGQTSKRPPALETKAVLEAATVEADRWGDPTVGTEHLLIALIRISQCAAAKTLQEHGVTEEAVSRETAQRRQGGSGGGRGRSGGAGFGLGSGQGRVLAEIPGFPAFALISAPLRNYT